MLDFQAARWLMAGEVPKQAGNDHPTSIPTGVFETSDGHINIAATGGGIYKRFCEAIGAPELATDPDYATGANRSKNRKALNAAIAAITRTQPSQHWIDLLNEAGVPTGPIYSIDEVFADPQVEHLKMAQPVDHPVLGPQKVVGQAVELSRTPCVMRSATPEQGADTDAILKGLGYGDAEIAALRAKNAI